VQVLLLFRGLPERAKAELLAYAATAHAQEAELADRGHLAALLGVVHDVAVGPEDEVMSLAFYEDSQPPESTGMFLPLTW